MPSRNQVENSLFDFEEKSKKSNLKQAKNIFNKILKETNKYKNYIIVHIACGYGNVFQILSGIYIVAQQLKCKVIIVSETIPQKYMKHLPLRLDKVFSKPKFNFMTRKEFTKHIINNNMKINILHPKEKWTDSTFQYYKYYEGNDQKTINLLKYVVNCQKIEKNSVVFSCWECDEHSPNTDIINNKYLKALIFKCLEPSKLIKKELDKVMKKHKKSNIVSIHIRLTDHPEMFHQTVDGIINEILEQVKQKPKNTKYILATDRYAIKQKLIKKLGNKLIYQKYYELKPYKGDNKEPDDVKNYKGSLAGILELFLLTKGKEFITNNRTTFTKTAIMMSYYDKITLIGFQNGGKNLRKHRGIIQSGGNKGKLKKGYIYTGKKTKTGLPIINKIS